MKNPARTPISTLKDQAKSQNEHLFIRDQCSIPDKSGSLAGTERRERIAGDDKHASTKHRESEFSLGEAEYLTAHVVSLKGWIGEVQHYPALLQGNADGFDTLDDASVPSVLNRKNGFPAMSGELKYIKVSVPKGLSHPPVFACSICNISFPEKKFFDLHLLSATHMKSLAVIVEDLHDEMMIDYIYPASIPGVDGKGSGPNYCLVCDSSFKNDIHLMIHFASLTHVDSLIELLWKLADLEPSPSKTLTTIQESESCATAKSSGEESQSLTESHGIRRDALVGDDPCDLQYPGDDNQITKEVALVEKESCVSSTRTERYEVGVPNDSGEIPHCDSIDPPECAADSSKTDESKGLLKRQHSFRDRAEKPAEGDSLQSKKRLLTPAEADAQLGGTTSALSTEVWVPESPMRYDSVSPGPSVPRTATTLPRFQKTPPAQLGKPGPESNPTIGEQMTHPDSGYLQHYEPPSMGPATMASSEANQRTYINNSQAGYIMEGDIEPLGANIDTIARLQINLYQQDVHLRRVIAWSLGDQDTLAALPPELDAYQVMLAVNTAKQHLQSLKTHILARREQGKPLENLSPPCPNLEETTINLCYGLSQLQQCIEAYKEQLASFRQAVWEGKPTDALPLLREEDENIKQVIQRCSCTLQLISGRPDLLGKDDRRKIPSNDSGTPTQPEELAPRATDLNSGNRADSKFTEKQLSLLNHYLLLGRHPTDDELRDISRKIGLTSKTIKNWLTKNMNEDRARPAQSSGEADSGIGSPFDIGCESSASPLPSDELTPQARSGINVYEKCIEAYLAQTEVGKSPQVEKVELPFRRG